MGAKIPVLFSQKIIPRRFEEEGLVWYTGFDVKVLKDTLDKFEKDILDTVSEYVYPTVFSFVGGGRRIDDDHLYKLRVWANVYRLNYSKNPQAYNQYYIYRLYLRAIDCTH